MSTLVVIGYNDPHQAEEVRLKLWKLQKDYLIDLEDAVVATKDAQGKIKLHQAVNLTAAGAVSGGLLGLPDRPDLFESAARPGGGRHGRGGLGGAHGCGRR
jgi:hypothetical protein